jgi:hypothetical protein
MNRDPAFKNNLLTTLSQISDSIEYVGREVRLLRQEIQTQKLSAIIDDSRKEPSNGFNTRNQ